MSIQAHKASDWFGTKYDHLLQLICGCGSTNPPNVDKIFGAIRWPQHEQSHVVNSTTRLDGSLVRWLGLVWSGVVAWQADCRLLRWRCVCSVRSGLLGSCQWCEEQCKGFEKFPGVWCECECEMPI